MKKMYQWIVTVVWEDGTESDVDFEGTFDEVQQKVDEYRENWCDVLCASSYDGRVVIY